MKLPTLKRWSSEELIKRPVLLVIMDGVGLYRGRDQGYEGNAVDQARTPVLDSLMASAPFMLRLKAHGKAVGLPTDGDMGNSEVGHNTIGGGRVFAQGASLVEKAIASRRLFEGRVWKEIMKSCGAGEGCLHFLGLLSDGKVHSHISHLKALIEEAAAQGTLKIRVHALADGRDVDPQTFDRYLAEMESFFEELRTRFDVDVCVASGGGRMKITMDRYEADWEMVRLGWETHVHGRGRAFHRASEAVAEYRRESPGIIDQDLPPFVIVDSEGNPCGKIEDGDAVIFFNFRGDRAIEISRAFTEDDFSAFDRGRQPDVYFAGMMEYDGDLHIPPRFLVEPPQIDRTLSEFLVHEGIRQLAIAETQKFGHVTYFWNGNNSEKFSEELEDWIEIPSDNISFDRKPAMKAREVCDALLDRLRSEDYGFLRVNFANGDMVGHTGSLPAAIEAMEVVDECLGRIVQAVEEYGALMLLTADHGNCDQMLEVDLKTGELKLDKKGRPIIKTSHTLSPVPFLGWGSGLEAFCIDRNIVDPGLGNIAATILEVMGFEAPDFYLPPLVRPC